MSFRWVAADESALSWIRTVATNEFGVGFVVGPMPDQAYVLHPILERVDGQPVYLVKSSANGRILDDQPDKDSAPLRRVTWAEYALRRATPAIQSGSFPYGDMPFADAVNHDVHVWSPDEGALYDPATQRALFEILIRHTPGREAAVCTAFNWAFGPSDPASDTRRGALGAWPELYDDDDPYSPQNLWPETHDWVLNTDPDSWATSISGSSALIDELIRSPHLEAVRPGRAS